MLVATLVHDEVEMAEESPTRRSVLLEKAMDSQASFSGQCSTQCQLVFEHDRSEILTLSAAEVFRALDSKQRGFVSKVA